MALGAVALAAGLALAQPAAVARDYPNNKALAQQLEGLAAKHKNLLRVETFAKAGKAEVWLVELGTGSREKRMVQPAMLAVAGIEGNDLAGSASLLAWIEQVAAGYSSDPKIRDLLDSTTLYVFPRLNPAAAERFFAKPITEIEVNDRPVDDDHDGLIDEDGPNDLDGDGRIAWMRVQDPDGDYILDPQEPRLLMKADRAKGEVGAWKLFREGTDDDHDEAWNEDGKGGVNLNRNFPFNYRFFAPGSGLHPVSEPVTRKLADFIVAHPNIGIIFTFGAADNLVATPKAEPAKRPPTTLHEEDLPVYRELGKAWREAIGLKKELGAGSEPGTFSDWMYFHRGRLSLAARPWSPALQLELAKAKENKPSDKEKPARDPESKSGDKLAETPDKKSPRKPEDDKRNEEDRAFLKWADTNCPELFVPWKPLKHPDFPGKTVEVGGFAPIAKSNPPEILLADLGQNQAQFLTRLAGKLPRIGIRKIQVKSLGNSVYDVTVQVENTGYLPTALAQGVVTREVNPTRVTLDAEDAAVLSGSRRTLLGPIEGSGGSKDVRWVIIGKGRDRIDVEVVSALGGTAKATVELKDKE